jgi:hypothetical protein
MRARSLGPLGASVFVASLALVTIQIAGISSHAGAAPWSTASTAQSGAVTSCDHWIHLQCV